MRLFFFLLITINANPEVAAEYPPTRRVDHVDTYHGVEVADPYRWLEGDVRESAEVADWVESQSEYARRYLDAIPARKVFARRLEALYDYERYSTPLQKAGRYFFRKNDGLQDQSVLYVANSPSDDGRVLLDPNTWSDDGTVALSNYSVSDDGQLIAFAKSSAGSDWKTIHVMEIETGKMHEDVLEWVRFGGIEWEKQSRGFYYSRYPEPEEGEQFQSLALNQAAYYHKLGDKQ
ncbi:MAG: S9 family peptidase, partial [Aeoliella sp.]